MLDKKDLRSYGSRGIPTPKFSSILTNQNYDLESHVLLITIYGCLEIHCIHLWRLSTFQRNWLFGRNRTIVGCHKSTTPRIGSWALVKARKTALKKKRRNEAVRLMQNSSKMREDCEKNVKFFCWVRKRGEIPKRIVLTRSRFWRKWKINDCQANENHPPEWLHKR